MISCAFSNVRERDMDMMFMTLFATDTEFVQLVAKKIPALDSTNLSVIDIVLSKADANLGESDITVITQCGDKRFAFLIEDKIDAIAMPNQHKRYHSRGSKGIKNGDYDAFEVFIFCPQKYYEANSEAKLYENHISYEEILEYLNTKDGMFHMVCRQQMEQAILKAKKPPEVQKNEAATDYYLHYREFQQSFYPDLDLRTKPGANGWWTVFGTNFGNTYIHHKTQEGFVDLTFTNAAKKIHLMQIVAEWLRKHGYEKVISVQAGNAAVLRIDVPQLAVRKPFDETPVENLHKCFTAIRDLSEIAKIFATAGALSVTKKEI